MTDTAQPTKQFRVSRGHAASVANLRGAIVTIGNFDGVHRGHRAAIALASARARTAGRPVAALTFEPHPRSLFQPEVPLFRLTDAEGKLRLLAATELDGAIVLPFDAELAALSAEAFVADILVARLAVTGALVGADFHFGAQRAGSPAFLAEQGRRHGFSVEFVPHFSLDGQPVSSGAVRAALAAGDIDRANTLLGYPWFLHGTVVHGDKRGRDLGFPTANIRVDPACQLRHGIYAVRVAAGTRRIDGVASFGRRPTFDNGPVLLEVFLFDFDGDLYGQPLDVALIARIRDELKFSDISDLVRQMHDDSQAARAALARQPDAFPPFGAVSS